MSKHTELPWEIGYGDGVNGDVASWSAHMGEVECHEVVIRHGCEAVAIIFYGDPDGPTEANARLIVNAVNNYDRLREQLIDCLELMEESERRYGQGQEAPNMNEEIKYTRALLTELDNLEPKP